MTLPRKAQVAIVRNEISADRKTRNVKCPLCKFEIKLVRAEDGTIGGLLGIGNENWVLADKEQAGLYDTWQTLYEDHIRSHPVSDIIHTIFKLEDDVAGWQGSAQRYSNFLNTAAGYQANHRSIRAIKELLTKDEEHLIPDEWN